MNAAACTAVSCVALKRLTLCLWTENDRTNTAPGLCAPALGVEGGAVPDYL